MDTDESVLRSHGASELSGVPREEGRGNTYELSAASASCAAVRFPRTWLRASAGAVWPVISALPMTPMALCAPETASATVCAPVATAVSLCRRQHEFRLVRGVGAGLTCRPRGP